MNVAVRRRLAVAWACLVACEVLCQVALKLAGQATGAFDFSARAFLAAATAPWLWVALGCYVGGFVTWMVILKRSSLSAAFPTSAIVFVAVIVASRVVFHEALTPLHLVGCAVIVGGIVLLGPDGESD